ncbi:hypothetical protein [Nocardia jejuensis]|uniref:hypothetical protein n=1 Tax=Nocardia jejuensis TaxID=328049 RepID=UPI000B02B54B|nr:hypothetical protein [Nocardia jejuensis]
MTSSHQPPFGHPDDNLGEFAEELRLLAEAVLERVEPVLRRTASDGRAEWNNCSWCPVCAAAAIVRGEHHDVVAAIADHGTAIVTVLREALAGVPVAPVIPPDLDPDSAEYHAWLHNSYGYGSTAASREDGTAASREDGTAASREGSTAASGEDWNDERDGHSPPEGAPESESADFESRGEQFAGGAAQTSSVAAGLSALIARFVAGAQGRGTAGASQTHRHFGATEQEDPLGRGPGAARDPASGPSGPGSADRAGDDAGVNDSGAGSGSESSDQVGDAARPKSSGRAGFFGARGRSTGHASDAGPFDDSAASEPGRPAAQPFGPPIGGPVADVPAPPPPGTSGRAGSRSDRQSGPEAAAASRAGRGGKPARGVVKPGYIPINVTIKA